MFVQHHDPVLKHLIVRNDVFRGLGRRFGFGMGHQVCNALVLQVSNSSNNRDRKFRDRPVQIIIIEDQEITLTATAANDHNGVIYLSAFEDL